MDVELVRHFPTADDGHAEEAGVERSARLALLTATRHQAAVRDMNVTHKPSPSGCAKSPVTH